MPSTVPTHDPAQHQTQSQGPSQPKDQPPKFDPTQDPAFKAFQKAETDFSASIAELQDALKNFKPSDDPRDIDKTKGMFDIANSLSGLRGAINEITRRIKAGPGGGVGGYAEGYAPETTPKQAPAPSEQVKPK